MDWAWVRHIHLPRRAGDDRALNVGSDRACNTLTRKANRAQRVCSSLLMGLCLGSGAGFVRHTNSDLYCGGIDNEGVVAGEPVRIASSHHYTLLLTMARDET